MEMKYLDEEVFITLSHGQSFNWSIYHKTSRGALMGHSDYFMLTNHFEKVKINSNRCYCYEILCRLKTQSYFGGNL